MRDVLRLRNRILQRAAICLPLAVPVAACAKEEPASPTTVNVPPGTGSSGIASNGSASAASSTPPPTTDDATNAAGADDAGVASARPVLPPSMRMPSCPHGAFCATKADMSKFATKTSAKTLDCPTEMESRERPDSLPGMPRPSYARISFDEPGTKGARADAGTQDKCCYTWAIPCPGGRPFMSEGIAHVATTRATSSCLGQGCAPTPSNLAPSAALQDARTTERARASAAWLADALSEHASIASFARATLELMALGAPLDLVAEHQRAALDEVRHAQRCFELARAYGGDALEPGPLPALPPREADFSRLARDTFAEGCVGETISALCASRAAEDAPRDVANVWRMLASDETKHAALAWKTLAWILRHTDSSFRSQLLVEAHAMATTPFPAAHASHMSDATTEGRLSARAIARAHADAWSEIVLPTLHALCAQRQEAA
jgi:hypothetical protein